MSSTPPRSSSKPLFSDSLTDSASSPPSSPPNSIVERRRDDKLTTDTSNPPAGPFKNVFSILGKRKPLTTASENARPVKTPKSSATNGLQQMQMSLGQKVNRRCDTCGMEYVPSSAEDRKLHDKYHKQNLDGFDLGKDFVAKKRRDGRKLSVFKGVKEGDAIVYLDCYDNHHRKKKGQAVLEVVQRELGAVAIPEAEIWDLKNEEINIPESKYKSFLYIRGNKCVGYLLTQRIAAALEVVKPPDTNREEILCTTASKPESSMKKRTALEKLKARKQQEADAAKALEDELAEASQHPLHLSDTRHSAVMGISRIWTSSSHRSHGIAQCLLNTAINRHNSIRDLDDHHEEAYTVEHGKPLPDDMRRRIERKQDVAFSQPTEAGAKLARKWFGRAYGWRVYVD